MGKYWDIKCHSRPRIFGQLGTFLLDLEACTAADVQLVQLGRSLLTWAKERRDAVGGCRRTQTPAMCSAIRLRLKISTKVRIDLMKCSSWCRIAEGAVDESHLSLVRALIQVDESRRRIHNKLAQE
jgi:hypothetical protein